METRKTLFQYVFFLSHSFFSFERTQHLHRMNYESSPLCVRIFYYLASFHVYIYFVMKIVFQKISIANLRLNL